MPRDAVWTLLNGDSQLATLGGEGFVAIPQYAEDQRPEAAAFIEICWRHVDFNEDMQENTERHFDIYVNIPKKTSTDFVRIDKMLDRCDEIFAGVAEATDPVIGDDGWQLNFVVQEGRGLDIVDDEYRTICKQASYMALACKANA